MEDSKKKSQKCHFPTCKKKLTLVEFACRCGNIYCSTHRQAEYHACSFDYKTIGIRDLSNSLIKVIGKRVDVI